MNMTDTNFNFSFQWHITNQCNNKCNHCYQKIYSDKNITLELLLDVFRKIEEALKKWNVNGEISITGGEPFTRKGDLYKIIEAIEESPQITAFAILSNGSMITNSDILKLKSMKKLLSIQLSLEGATKKVHDGIRGDGDWDKVIRSIKLLKLNEIDVSIMTTLSRANKGEILPLLELLKGLDVDFFALDRLIPEGNARGMITQMLDQEEIKETYSKVVGWSLLNKTPEIFPNRPLYTLLQNMAKNEVGGMCAAGVNTLTIMPDGTIFPCRRLPISIGNVFSEGIITTWFTSELLWKLRDIDSYKGKCKNCEQMQNCRGCRAMAYFLTGDYMEADPQCWK